MNIAVSSDEYLPLVEALLSELKERGHNAIYVGATPGNQADWPDVTAVAMRKVQSGEAQEAIALCWTGTGATIAANKCKGIRASLCHDAKTAMGGRIWNHANVLTLSLRTTSIPVMKEILEAWFSTPISEDEWNRQQMEKIRLLEDNFGK